METKINAIIVDSSASETELCRLGAEYGTDKSPYNPDLHRHPYTAIYDLLFSSQRHSPINFAEIGIWRNASMKMWRRYFSVATLYGFDVSRELIDSAREDALYCANYDWLDINNPETIHDALTRTGKVFDVIIDDSSHFFENQIAIVSAAYRFLRPGGIYIMEDLHKPWGNKRYADALVPYLKYFSSCTFIEAEHVNKFSGGSEVPWFDNDKLLVMHRNQVPALPR